MTTTQTTHTPGPWTVEALPRVVVDSRRVWVASADASYRPDAECLANARLIAAAPELLDALIKLVEANGPILASFTDDGLIHGGPPVMLSIADRNARAAIAKATA